MTASTAPRATIRTDPPRGRPLPIHVILLATVPAMMLWAGNATQLRSLYPLRVVIGCAIAALVILAIVLVVQRDVRRAGLIASGTVTLACTIGLVLGDPTRALVNILGFVVGLLLIVRLAARLPDAAIRNVTILLNVVAVAVVTVNAAVVAMNRPGAFTPDQAALTATSPGRDVWYLVPDRFPTEATLDELGLGQSAFFDGLRARGFDVVDQARANYPQTSVSLAASWGLDYPDDPAAPTEVYGRLEDPRIGQLFDDAGYHYTHLGSWPEFSADSASADSVLTLKGAGEFWTAWEATTLLPTVRYLLDVGTPGTVSYARQVEHGQYQLSRLHTLARTDREDPEFVLAHLVLPHGPYIYREDGTLRSRSETVDDRVGYVEQARFFGDEVLRIVDELLAREEPPVIVLLADEGLYPEDLDEDTQMGDVDPATYSDEEIQQKMSILAAVYDPDRTSTGLSEQTTALNVVRDTVSSVLSLDLPLLRDRAFRWADKDYQQLREIPHEVLWPGDTNGSR